MRSKTAIYNIITNLILQIVIIIYGFVVPKIIITNFGSSVNGLVSSVTQFLAYIALLESGFGPIVKSVLYKPIANKDKDSIAKILKASEKFFRTISYIFILYIIVLSLAYPIVINKEFSFVYSFSLILIISISTFAEYYFGMTYRLYLQAEQKSYIVSIIQIVTYIISVALIIILAKLNFSIHLIKLFSGLIFVLRPIIQNLYVKKRFSINLSHVDSNYKIKQKWDGLAQHIASVIHNNTDVTILTIFSTLVEVSVYSVYTLVTKGLKSICFAFNSGIDAIFGDMLAKNENETLNKSFRAYEFVYFTTITIMFTCAALLIVPFIRLYTIKVTDANYIRPLFAHLMIWAEFANMIRLPYISITYSAGHFKETMKGAWVESILNLVISIILVFKFGLIGVAIGTLIATGIRTIEFNYHASKYILKRDIKLGSFKPVISIIELLILYWSLNFIHFFTINTYMDWILQALIILFVSTLVICAINCLLFKQEFNYIKSIMKKVAKR